MRPMLRRCERSASSCGRSCGWWRCGRAALPCSRVSRHLGMRGARLHLEAAGSKLLGWPGLPGHPSDPAFASVPHNHVAPLVQPPCLQLQLQEATYSAATVPVLLQVAKEVDGALAQATAQMQQVSRLFVIGGLGLCSSRRDPKMFAFLLCLKHRGLVAALVPALYDQRAAPFSPPPASLCAL